MVERRQFQWQMEPKLKLISLQPHFCCTAVISFWDRVTDTRKKFQRFLLQLLISGNETNRDPVLNLEQPGLHIRGSNGDVPSLQ